MAGAGGLVIVPVSNGDEASVVTVVVAVVDVCVSGKVSACVDAVADCTMAVGSLQLSMLQVVVAEGVVRRRGRSSVQWWWSAVRLRLLKAAAVFFW